MFFIFICNPYCITKFTNIKQAAKTLKLLTVDVNGEYLVAMAPVKG